MAVYVSDTIYCWPSGILPQNEIFSMKGFWAIFVAFVSNIAVFVLKGDIKLQLTNFCVA